jgi:hypothetical protein
MPPVFLWHTRRVNFTATDLEPLAIEEKIVVANCEGMSGAGASGSRELIRE